ncbi:zinc-ribbon domain-containing protein [Actinomycetospora lutea]|uniref:zinc-ribbon domain-containing protein n=1 Tax=Actinomycetospora lutea TaxID=663604 RepID=UPI00236524D9|nr:zinc-ribbon domain-containing protein [Actinomycetospora lutea]MDD7936983.1 zinc-ribbon domain-containing protein [Actinomycetospora lutea]
MPRSLDPSRTLAARFPALAAQWHPDRNGAGPGRCTPDTIPATSPATVWWRCAEGHEWQDKVATRTGMPKWKNSDVAACPECVHSPTRLVAHTYIGCGHTRTVQRKNAEKNQQNCWDCGSDPHPAKDAARRERKRASALASYYRRKERGRPLTEEERAAQRALVGFLNGAAIVVSDGGVTWWRNEVGTAAFAATTTETLSTWLTTLRVQHSIALRKDSRGPRAMCTGVHIDISSLGDLKRWTPAFLSGHSHHLRERKTAIHDGSNERTTGCGPHKGADGFDHRQDSC